MVAEHTFRPPWFHRNVMSEFMGLIARRLRRQGRGFLAGRRIAAQLHVWAWPRRRDLRRGRRGRELTPQKVEDTLAFMFETRHVIRPTRFALETDALQRDYRLVLGRV